MKDSTHNFILSLFALLIVLTGLVVLTTSFEPGGFATLGWIVAGLFCMAVGIGFWKRKGWAFLTISVGLLVGFFRYFIGMILAIDRGEGFRPKLWSLLAVIACIAYLGRWSIERRFRGHLESEPH